MQLVKQFALALSPSISTARQDWPLLVNFFESLSINNAMSAEVCAAPAQLPRLDSIRIQAQVVGCPRLPSLRSIDGALRELLNADQRYTHQIAEVIRRDPSMTSRLLRLVNSVYYSLPTPVSNL